jgi:hypothetical protein
VQELEDAVALMLPNADYETPAEICADNVEALRFLSEIGGTAALLVTLQGAPGRISEWYPLLLAEPGLLDMKTKQAWLSWQLQQVVGDADAASLSLVSNRASVLDGLCAALGVDESTGRVAAQPGGIDVRFDGENGTGDGLRREWFGQAFDEMLLPDRGLFLSKDGGRTLQPNPHSATAAGADHLAYFALLGRITGLALFHGEPVNAHWSSAFLKALLGYEIAAADMEYASHGGRKMRHWGSRPIRMAAPLPRSASAVWQYRRCSLSIPPCCLFCDQVDPELYEKRIVYLRDSVYASRDGIALDDLGLTFIDDSNDEQYTEGRGRAVVELKPGGGDIEVTESNKEEYLQLFAEHGPGLQKSLWDFDPDSRLVAPGTKRAHPWPNVAACSAMGTCTENNR